MSRRPSIPAALKQPLLRLHFYAGLFIAPFLLVSALTGLAYALSYPVEDALYADLKTVEAEGEPLTLARQVGAVAEAHPDWAVTAVRPASEAEASTEVLVDDGVVRESGAVAVVYVNPYSGEILGESTTYGSSKAGPVREWVSTLHRSLHLGEPGRLYSELAASWLWVVALGGLVLWVSRRRRGLLRPRPEGSARSRTLAWHGPVGLWLVAVLVFLSATGLTWSRYAGEHVSELRAALDWSTPSLSTDAGSSGGDHAAHDHSGASGSSVFAVTLLDGVHDAALDAGLRGQLQITLPTGESTQYLVAETDRSFPVQQDQLVVDAASGAPEVTEALWFADWPFMAQATSVLIAAHMGLLFGLANQLVLAAAMVAVVLMIAWGYRMWWLRRPKGGLVGRAYPRGSLRRLPWPAVAVVIAVAAGLGWFFPLLGVSLAAFAAVDVLLGLRQRFGKDAGDAEGSGGARMSRRAALATATISAAVGAGAGMAIGSGSRSEGGAAGDEDSGVEPFYGERQAGIATPMQGHALFAAFNLALTDMASGSALDAAAVAENLRALLADWSAVAAALTSGEAVPKFRFDSDDQFDAEAVAAGLAPARLTVTMGIGPEAFGKAGLEAARPSKLVELPEFDGDRLQAAWSGGDLLLQICGDDQQVVSNAFLELRKRAVGRASLLWMQQGFSSAPGGATPRNLMGFKDGSANPAAGSAEFDERVWARDAEPDWFEGGTYLVFRKIRMRLPDWSRLSAEEQNLTFGRERDSGVPLSGGGEFDHPDFTAKDASGLPAVPADSHIAVVHDAAMVRRGCNYDYGFLTQAEVSSDAAADGHLDGHTHAEHPYDAGLLFVSFQADPQVFVDAQEQMAASDRLSEFIVAEGSAVFAVPPGAPEGGFIGEGLF